MTNGIISYRKTKLRWTGDVHGFVVSQQECCFRDSIHMFQVAELCLLFALAKGICCFEAWAVDNSGCTGERSWKEEKVITEKTVQLIEFQGYTSPECGGRRG